MFTAAPISRFALMLLNVLPVRKILRKEQKKKFQLAEKPEVPSGTKFIVLLDPARSMTLKDVKGYFREEVVCTTDPKKALNHIPETGRCVLITGYRLESSENMNGSDMAYRALDKNEKTEIILVSSTPALAAKKTSDLSPFSKVIYMKKGTSPSERVEKIIELIKKSA